MINVATNPTVQIISQHVFAEIIQDTVTGQRSLHALKLFKEGDLVSKFFAGEIYKTANYLTVQRGIDEHITLKPEFLQYINHSCNPNVFFDTEKMELKALKNIEPSQEFTFFYPSTELDMAQPFICFCGSKSCLQNIRGANYIPGELLQQYRLTEFIQRQVLHKLQPTQ